MRREEIGVRKLIITATIATALLAGTIQSQAAANTAVAIPGSFVAGYATPQLVIHKGGPATFVNLDIEDHDIRSVVKKPNDATKPLFSSAIIETGEYATIDGISATPAGDYEFFCVVHSDMRGTATIVQ